MIPKNSGRERRAKKTRALIKRLGSETGIVRLTLHRSSQHIYAQILAPLTGKVLARADSLELRKERAAAVADKKITKTQMAIQVGKLLAERALKADISKVACDRSGFLYHGRIKALVDSLREHGILV